MSAQARKLAPTPPREASNDNDVADLLAGDRKLTGARVAHWLKGDEARRVAARRLALFIVASAHVQREEAMVNACLDMSGHWRDRAKLHHGELLRWTEIAEHAAEAVARGRE